MILITEFMDIDAVETMAQRHDVRYLPTLGECRPAALQEAATATALVVRNRTCVDQELLEAAPDLACVGRLGVGLDNIDLEQCALRDVKVYPASGANDQSVAEYVVGSAMILLRGAYLRSAEVVSGAWPRQECSGKEMAGKTMGIIGLGSTGKRTAELAAALGMRIVAYDPFLDTSSETWTLATKLDLDELLEQADVISLHIPLNRNTHHLLDRNRLSSAKRGAILINAARGGIVDEDAMIGLLQNGHLGGAAVDVFETEPVTQESGNGFKGLGNVILTPHIAGVTAESNSRVSAMIAGKVMSHLDASGKARSEKPGG